MTKNWNEFTISIKNSYQSKSYGILNILPKKDDCAIVEWGGNLNVGLKSLRRLSEDELKSKSGSQCENS